MKRRITAAAEVHRISTVAPPRSEAYCTTDRTTRDRGAVLGYHSFQEQIVSASKSLQSKAFRHSNWYGFHPSGPELRWNISSFGLTFFSIQGLLFFPNPLEIAMKKCLFVFLLPLLLLFTSVVPTTFAQAPRNPAKSYIERAVEEMGGVSRLEAVKTARVEYWGHRYLLEESERPDGPWIVAYEKANELRDYQRGVLHEDEEQWGLGLEEGVKSSMTVADGVAQTTTGDQPRPLSMEQVVDAQEELDFSPNRL